MNPVPISEHLLEAMLNGAGQGIVVTLLVALVLKLFPGTNASTRHAVWLVTLLVVAALPAVHLLPAVRAVGDRVDASEMVSEVTPLLVQEEDGQPLQLQGEVLVLDPGTPEAADVWAGDLAWMGVGPGGANLLVSRTLIDELRVENDPAYGSAEASSHPDGLARWPAGPLAGAHPLSPGWDQAPGESQAQPQPTRWQGLSAIIPDGWRIRLPWWIAPVLVLTWILVASVRLGILAWECLQVRALKRGSSVASEELLACFQRIGNEMGLRRKARLLVGPPTEIPMVAGFWKPAVIVPAGFPEGTSTEQFEQVLRHELAHVRRWDDWVNIAQQILQAIFFFHPAVRWITERLSLEREIACDDHVLAAASKPRAYALLLTDFAGRRQGRDLIAAPAAWNRKTQLKERIAMILDSKRNSSPRLAGTLAGGLLLAIVAGTGLMLQAAPRLALGDDNSAPETAEASATAEAVASVEASADPATTVTLSSDLTPPEPPEPVDVAVNAPVQLAVSVSSSSSGPRPKPAPRAEAVALYAPADDAIPAEPPVPPTPPVALAATPSPAIPPPLYAPAEIRTSADVKVERTAPRSRGRGGDNSSLEQRMERLERMMDKLMTGANVRWDKQLTELKDLSVKLDMDPKRIAKIINENKNTQMALAGARKEMSEAEITKMHEQIERGVQKAGQEAQRAAKEALRERSKGARSAGNESHVDVPEQRSLETQRAALESARRSLEKQMKDLEKQMDRLGKESDRLEKHIETLHEKADKEKDKDEDKDKDKAKNESDDQGDSAPKKVKKF